MSPIATSPHVAASNPDDRPLPPSGPERRVEAAKRMVRVLADLGADVPTEELLEDDVPSLDFLRETKH